MEAPRGHFVQLNHSAYPGVELGTELCGSMFFYVLFFFTLTVKRGAWFFIKRGPYETAPFTGPGTLRAIVGYGEKSTPQLSCAEAFQHLYPVSESTQHGRSHGLQAECMCVCLCWGAHLVPV